MISNEELEKVLKRKINTDCQFERLGTVLANLPNTLTYAENNDFLSKALENPNIKGILCKPEKTKNILTDKLIIESLNPGYDFIRIHNHFHNKIKIQIKSKISEKAKIHKTAIISEYNVIIEDNVEIGPYVVIYSNVYIRKNTVINSNSVLGCEDIEAKRSNNKFVNAYHDSSLEIGDSCLLGSSVIISKGIYGRPTKIGNNTIISNNTIIAHSVEVGNNSTLLGPHICGSVIIGKNVRINPKAVISNGLKIGDNSIISLGAVVISDVKEGTRVSGHYATEHLKFLYKYIKTFGKI